MLIAHATDLTGDDASAFVHAAAIARLAGAELVSLYAGRNCEASLDAGELAARWGVAIRHEFRRVECDDDVADALIDSLRELRPTLVVVGTHARHGLATVLHGSVGEAIARNMSVPVLIVPNNVRGFVDPRTGSVNLQRIIIASGTAEDAKRGIDTARDLVALLGSPSTPQELVHVGALDREILKLDVDITRLQGALETAINRLAETYGASLVVMHTRGHDSIGDVVLGSHSERVLRAGGRPMLLVRD